jgi:shikimate kinase
VIATGGSVIYRPQAMRHLQQLGRVVSLDIELGSLVDRLNSLDARGVVYAPGQSIDMLYAERSPLYQRHACITVDCTHLNPDQVVGKIIAAVGKSF